MPRRFTDDDILRILGAGDSGLKVADLCAAEHITPKTYYHWKVKYGDLTPDEMKQRRLRERMYRHAAGAAAILVAIGAVYFAVDFGGGQAPRAPVIAPRSSPSPRPVSPQLARPPASLATTPQALPASSASTAQAPPAPSATTQQAPPPSSATTRQAQPAEEVPLPDDVLATDPEGSAIQVAAVTLLGDARRARDRLIGSGYPAYVTRAINAQGEVYRVRVGPLASRAAAEDSARRLEGDGYAKVWIVR